MSKMTFAQEDNSNIGVSETRPEIMQEESDLARGLGRPDKSNEYAFGQAHLIQGFAEGSTLYSNKCFHGVKTITMTIRNDSSEDLVVTLYKYGFLNIERTVQKVTIPADGKGYYAAFENLDDDAHYYFSFSAPSDFRGYVTGYKY